MPSYIGLAVSSPKLGEHVRLPVEDLSVPMDGHAGGMRLRADAAVARVLSLGSEVPVSIHVPGEAHPLPGQIHLLRMTPSANTPGAPMMLGVQYRMSHHRDEGKLERLWMQCQRLFKAAEARAPRG